MTLPERALATIRRHGMLPRGGRVVVALSGGPDSVALVDLLRTLEANGEAIVAGVAHFNHQLRSAADEDERFCRALADGLGLPIVVGRGDVREVAQAEKRSIEDAARRLRYAFLERAADELAADAIAVGQTLDDQAETFLLRIVRGAGTRGLGSIRPKAGRVIRPLIEIGRAELRQYAGERGLSFREDETNADTSIPRNRVRHELLPYLEREFSPGIVQVLAREAALARDDDDWLEQQAIELAASLVLTDAPPSPLQRDGGQARGSVVVDVRALTALHPALASRVARRALETLASGRFIGYEHIVRFLEFARSAAHGQAVSLPGQKAIHRGTSLVVEPERPRGVEQLRSQFCVPLAVPGEVRTDHWAIGSEWSNESVRSGTDSVLIGGDHGPLSVRFRKAGDRLMPPGMGGQIKKLQDYLVDRKVPREERDRLPLVVDEKDRIVWVVGHGVSEGFRASAASPGVILLKARRLGGEV